MRISIYISLHKHNLTHVIGLIKDGLWPFWRIESVHFIDLHKGIRMKIKLNRYSLSAVVLIVSLGVLVASILTRRSRISEIQNSSTPKKSILIDSYHAHNYNVGLYPENYDYHSLHSCVDLFNFFKSLDINVEEHVDGHLNSKELRQHGLLFINLVSDDLPAFTVQEILDIKQFVKEGGNLLIITDHSNCYNHAHKLEPLFIELGLKIYRETACDTYNNAIGNGKGWVLINDFKKHPVTKDLKKIVFQTGGTVDDDYAVATLSANGWGDYYRNIPWGEDIDRGFYGNWKLDKTERQGRLGTILAKEFGKGKIAVVGDQNNIGNFWVKYADNYKLYLNIVNWMLGETIEHSEFVASKTPNVLFLENYRNAVFGDPEPPGYYNAFFACSKRYWTFSSDTIEHEFSLIILTPRTLPLGENNKEMILKHVESGKPVIFLNEESELSTEGQELVECLSKEDRLQVVENSEELIKYRNSKNGSISVILNAYRFNNENTNHPASEPTPTEIVAMNSFGRIVKDSLQIEK